MKIIDLIPEYEKTYFLCFEDWSEEIKEAGNHKEEWYSRAKNTGLRVKIALNETGQACGMIQYMPVEEAPFAGKDLYIILCIWIHGHKKGVGNQQNRGMGKALLKAAEEDVIQLGGKGLAAWGIVLPFFMRSSWFRKNGYSVVDKDGIMRLLWKPFSADAAPPSFIRPLKLPPAEKKTVNVSAFIHGWCPAQNLIFERARRVSEEFPAEVRWCEYHTAKHEVFEEWGISDGLFINGRKVRSGPPPSIDKIRRKVTKAVRKAR
jgi:hypothetical protein